jgi:hypothetical protein
MIIDLPLQEKKFYQYLLQFHFHFLIVTSIGPALLSVIGFLKRSSTNDLTLDFIKFELTSGTLALRISSIIIAYHVIELEIKRISRLLELQNKSLMFIEDTNKSNITISEIQYLFYGIIAAAIWQNVLHGEDSNVAALAAFLLFYILDDWTIIQEYLIDLSTPPSFWLYYKILTVNILLLFSLIILSLNTNYLGKTIFFVIPLICIFPFWIDEFKSLKGQILARSDSNKN